MIETWCPECGPEVPHDEDGCCDMCGAACMGKGVEALMQLQEKYDELVRAHVHFTRYAEIASRAAARCRSEPGVCWCGVHITELMGDNK